MLGYTLSIYKQYTERHITSCISDKHKQKCTTDKNKLEVINRTGVVSIRSTLGFSCFWVNRVDVARRSQMAALSLKGSQGNLC